MMLFMGKTPFLRQKAALSCLTKRLAGV